MNNCPACNKPDSAYDDHFCGRCENLYREDEKKEIAELIAELNSCCGNKDEYCRLCHKRYVHLLSLTGKEDEAIAYLNQ